MNTQLNNYLKHNHIYLFYLNFGGFFLLLMFMVGDIVLYIFANKYCLMFDYETVD